MSTPRDDFATRTSPHDPPSAIPIEPQTALHRFDRRLSPFAGPLLVAVCVLFATRGYLLTSRLTNQHPDILSMWLP
ncbi:MAG TPA: hypothetical protein VNN79_08290, partial [Actinomycetota bacterium]|nr:hypothetical protein [Actinomycetota bacterium]